MFGMLPTHMLALVSWLQIENLCETMMRSSRPMLGWSGGMRGAIKFQVSLTIVKETQLTPKSIEKHTF